MLPLLGIFLDVLNTIVARYLKFITCHIFPVVFSHKNTDIKRKMTAKETTIAKRNRIKDSTTNIFLWKRRLKLRWAVIWIYYPKANFISAGSGIWLGKHLAYYQDNIEKDARAPLNLCTIKKRIICLFN